MCRVGLPKIHDQQAFMVQDVASAAPWHRTEFGFNDERADGRIVGVVDTGFDETHCTQGALKDSVVKHRNFSDSPTHWARHPHGSHVAGIIQTIAPGVKMLSAKALGDQGGGNDRGLSDGIRWCVDEGADVVNVSAGAPMPSDIIRDACDYAAKHKIPVVAASGNEGSTTAMSADTIGALAVSWPAGFASTIAVGCIDRNRKLATFSNQGLKVQCVAPGVNILSLGLYGGFIIQSGTSMSAPWVSGLLAIVKKASGFPFSLEFASELIEACCDDLDTQGRDKATGWGLPVPAKFLAKVMPPPVPPGPPPVVVPGLPNAVVIGTDRAPRVVLFEGEIGIFLPAK